MRKTASMFLCIIIALLALTACAPTQVVQGGETGAFAGPGLQYPSVTQGRLDGTRELNFTAQTTPWLSVGTRSELTIWANCSGAVNVSATVQYAMDDRLVLNLTTISCMDNLTKYDATGTGVGLVRFALSGNASALNMTANASRVILAVAMR